MIRKLLIKHVTGGLILDTHASNCPFTLNAVDNQWEIEVHQLEPTLLARVIEQIDELNLFYFEMEGDGSIRKWWIYGKETPYGKADHKTGNLLLRLDTRVSYSNDRVSGS